jgi:uncharacterized membrane protein
MRRFSFRPALTLRGRAFKGLRGWAGKPLHPPLTDIPVGAYMLAAAFDVISFAGGDDRAWARDFYRAASFALIGGAAMSLLAALTGFWDWKRSTEKGTQARRTVNAHAWTMLTVTALVFAGIAVRVAVYWDEQATPLLALVLTLAAAAFTFLGGTIGGTLAYDYGFNVETAGDHPVWHPSETDVFPGDKHDGTPAPLDPTAATPSGTSDGRADPR